MVTPLIPSCRCFCPGTPWLLLSSRHCLVTSETDFAQGASVATFRPLVTGVVQTQSIIRKFRRPDILAQRWGSLCFRGCCRGRKGPDSPLYPFSRECLVNYDDNNNNTQNPTPVFGSDCGAIDLRIMAILIRTVFPAQAYLDS